MFYLSKELLGHGQDVKAIATHEQQIFSASRDGTVRQWTQNDTASAATHQYEVHQGFVNAIAYHEGYIVSGGQDSIINLVLPGTDKPEYSLIGHSANVCALHSNQDVIVSGSWDGTAKLWRDGQCIATMEGHQGAVWTVLCTDQGILTGGADRTIRLWKDGKQIKNYPAGKDCVRALALHPLGFVSAGNDAIIRVHSFDGQILHQLEGHESFIYSLAVADDGTIYSAGEDKTLRIWKDYRLTQTIAHPAVSVWTVALLSNGDVVSGSSDAAVRVFTSSEERKATTEDLKNFEKSATVAAMPSQASNIPNNLPGLEALAGPGSKEGEVKMIRTSPDLVEAHQWSGGVWTKIGEVVGASSKKVEYDGKEWDFVFDVDIAEGQPPLKLPYNTEENPYEAANRFIAKYELDEGFQSQIVKFIENNTGGIPLGVPKDKQVAPESKQQYLMTPQRSPLVMTAGNSAPIKKKIVDFAKELQDSQAASLDAMDLEKPSVAQIEILMHAIKTWPRDKRFPCLDLLRMCIVNAPKDGINLEQYLPSIISAGDFSESPDKTRETNMMLALRFIANYYSWRPNDPFMLKSSDSITAAMAHVNVFTNRNLCLALSTCQLNAAASAQSNSSETDAINLIEVILHLLGSTQDAEVQFRALIAFGTILHISEDVVEAAKEVFEAVRVIKALTAPDERVGSAIKEVLGLLGQ